MLNKKRPLKKSSTVLITQILGMITEIVRVFRQSQKGLTPLEKVHLASPVKNNFFNGVRKNSQTGLTLIEVLIALVVTLVLFMALMQSALLSIGINTSNVLRDEAVSIAEERMNEARSLDFDNLSDDPNPIACPVAGFVPIDGELILRDIRNITGFTFCTNRTVTDLGVDNKEVVITVGWNWQEEDRTHSVLTLVRRP